MFCVALLAVACTAFAQNTPAKQGKQSAPAQPKAPQVVNQLAPLHKLMDDEDKVVEALRQFDVTQQALFKMDIDLAAEYNESGDTDAAKAKIAQANHRIELVRKAYEEVLKRYPKNAKALNYYGEILYDRYKDYPKAIECWKTSAVLDSKFSPPLNNLALYDFHFGDHEMGFHYLEKAMKLDPDNPDYLYNAVQIYLIHWPEVQKRKKWSKKHVYKVAMKMSRRAAELLPHDFSLQEDYAVNFFAADRFDIKPDWREAAKAWEKARAQAYKQDDIFYTWLNEARVWKKVGNWERAQSCLKEALAIHPDSTAAKNLLDTVQGKLKNAGA